MSNPLLELDQLPSFTRIRPEHVEPAVHETLAHNRSELDAALADGRLPDEDVVLRVETLQHRLERVWSPVGHLNAVVNSEPLRSAYNACLPLLSDYSTELGQDERLYGVYRRAAERDPGGDEAWSRLIAKALRDFRLAGVELSAEHKARFKAIAQQLSKLSARFEENVLDATEAWHYHCRDRATLAGLPDYIVGRAAEAAGHRRLDGWLLPLDHPTYFAVLSHAEHRPLRKAFYQAWVTRASDQGPNAGRFDNAPVMEEILRLRHESARLLGYADYTDLSLATKMAESAGQVLEFLDYLARASVPAARRELDELQQFAGRELTAWDVPYYAEQLRQQRFSISDQLLRPYFPLPRVLSGLFELVRRLFAIDIRPVDGIETWHPDVAYFELRDEAGAARGGFYIDLYARSQKRGGAWMDQCIGRQALNGAATLPVAYLVCNFLPPERDRPALLSHAEVVTLLHEFGHVLHHLLTRVDYPSLAGINGVPWDAVELPSQFLENFAWDPQVLAWLSGHYRTGEPLPAELHGRLTGSRNFHAGLQSVRQLEFALFDMRLHRDYDPARGGRIYETLAEVRRQVSVIPAPVWNRFANGFSHIFGGGYAAGYYSYKWAEVLAADAYEAFVERGVFDRTTARRFAESILERGGACDAMQAFVQFRGRPPDPDALLRLHGIIAHRRPVAEERPVVGDGARH